MMKIEYLGPLNIKECNFKLYSFTTENVAGYFPLFNFHEKNILTVASSGDHLINAILLGCKDVTGFDINGLALVYTELKMCALDNLSYHEFLDFFMIDNENGVNYKTFSYSVYCQFSSKLTKRAKNIWDSIYCSFDNDGFRVRHSSLFNNKYDTYQLKIKSNLYLSDERTFHETKSKLKDVDIHLTNCNFLELSKEFVKQYNIIFLSNISDYIKDIYQMDSGYLSQYINCICKLNSQKICFAYIYDIENKNFRSEIDDSNLRKKVFKSHKIHPDSFAFPSVISGCKDCIYVL